MSIYVIIPAGESLGAEVQRLFPDQDRCQAGPGVWVVRSQRLTSSEVVNDLGIKLGGKNGIVVTAKHYDGIAGRGLVEKLSAWGCVVNPENVLGFPERPVTGNGGGGNGVDARLRAVEDAIREIKADVKGFDARLRAVEGDTREIRTRMHHVATRAWVPGGILAGMGVAAGIGVGLARLFISQ